MTNNIDVAARQRAKSMLRQDYERQMVSGRSEGAAAGFERCGPPYWDRGAWEAFRAANGFYPYGVQGDGVVMPPSFAGAPDWVYDLLNLRKPPVEVAPQ